MTEVTGIHRLINKRKKKKKQKSSPVKNNVKSVSVTKKSEREVQHNQKTSSEVTDDVSWAIKNVVEVPDSAINPLKNQRNTSARMRRREFWVHYIDILGVSACIQMIGYIASIMVGNAEAFKNSPVAPLLVFGAFFGCSIIFSICFALKVNVERKYKLIHIFCMPTNYTWLIVAVFIYAFTKIAVAIGAGLPSNFE